MPDLDPDVLQLGVVHGVIVDAGDTGDCVPPFDPDDWGGADAEWAPCVPPSDGGRAP